MDQEKRQLRELKRTIKRTGNKRRRQHLKRELARDPEAAPHTEFDFGRDSSAEMNAFDSNATRGRKKRND